MLGLAVAVRSALRPDRPITALMYGNMMIIVSRPGPGHCRTQYSEPLALVHLTLATGPGPGPCSGPGPYVPPHTGPGPYPGPDNFWIAELRSAIPGARKLSE